MEKVAQGKPAKTGPAQSGGKTGGQSLTLGEKLGLS